MRDDNYSKETNQDGSGNIKHVANYGFLCVFTNSAMAVRLKMCYIFRDYEGWYFELSVCL